MFGLRLFSVLFHAVLAVAGMLVAHHGLDFSWLVAWLVSINALTFFKMGADKWAATSKRRRTPEALLLLLAFAGGFPGLFAGRKVFRHKTQDMGFIIPMWIVFALQVATLSYAALSTNAIGPETLGFKKKAPAAAAGVPATPTPSAQPQAGAVRTY